MLYEQDIKRFLSWLAGFPGVCSRGALQLSWNMTSVWAATLRIYEEFLRIIELNWISPWNFQTFNLSAHLTLGQFSCLHSLHSRDRLTLRLPEMDSLQSAYHRANDSVAVSKRLWGLWCFILEWCSKHQEQCSELDKVLQKSNWMYDVIAALFASWHYKSQNQTPWIKHTILAEAYQPLWQPGRASSQTLGSQNAGWDLIFTRSPRMRSFKLTNRCVFHWIQYPRGNLHWTSMQAWYPDLGWPSSYKLARL